MRYFILICLRCAGQVRWRANTRIMLPNRLSAPLREHCLAGKSHAEAQRGQRQCSDWKWMIVLMQVSHAVQRKIRILALAIALSVSALSRLGPAQDSLEGKFLSNIRPVTNGFVK